MYASIEGDDPSTLHLVLLNKDAAREITIRVRLAGASYSTAQRWSVDASRAVVTARGALPGVSVTAMDVPIAPLTAIHLVLER